MNPNFFAAKFSNKQKRLWEAFVFLLKVIVFSIPLYIILTFHSILYPLQDIVSQNVYYVLMLFGFDAARNGFLLNIHGGNPFVFIVSEDCTGWKSMLFLTALVLAIPKVAWKRRATGLAFGIPLIYLGNLLRILIIVNVQQAYGIEFASVVHDYLWQAGLISLVLLVWVLWLAWAGKIKMKFLKDKKR